MKTPPVRGVFLYKKEYEIILKIISHFWYFTLVKLHICDILYL